MLVSGAFMNYITALILIVLMFGIYGQPTLNTYKLKPTEEVVSEYIGFREKDTIITANGRTVYLVSDLMNAIDGYAEDTAIPFTVRRDGRDIDIKVILKCDAVFSSLEDAKTLYDALGIYYETGEKGIQNSGLYSTYIRLPFFTTIGRTFEYSAKLGGTILAVLGQLITGRIGISSMGGTVTTIALTADAISRGGFRYFLNMASLIGVNLAVFNLLPIPALDGSRVVFTIIEWIRGKPINRKVEGIIHAVGFFLLIAFAILIDLQRCF